MKIFIILRAMFFRGCTKTHNKNQSWLPDNQQLFKNTQKAKNKNDQIEIL